VVATAFSSARTLLTFLAPITGLTNVQLLYSEGQAKGRNFQNPVQYHD
jgi:hypothetical protein